jgi:peroxiredoxin Q/BCP
MEVTMSFPKVGQKAITFKLQNQDGETVDLKEYLGKKNIVLYFYPKASTPGCTVQACGIRDSKKDFAKLDTVVFGLSPDPLKSLIKFKENQKLNFDLLSDEEHKIAEKYGAWGEKSLYGKKYMGILRSTMIIGKDGKFHAVMEKVNTKTHHDDVIAFIKENLS